MIRTFVDALLQRLGQSIMRNEKNKTIRWWMYHKKTQYNESIFINLKEFR